MKFSSTTTPGRVRPWTFLVRRPDGSRDVDVETFYAATEAVAVKHAAGWCERMGYRLVNEQPKGGAS